MSEGAYASSDFLGRLLMNLMFQPPSREKSTFGFPWLVTTLSAAMSCEPLVIGVLKKGRRSCQPG